jgi:hypothetical protein
VGCARHREIAFEDPSALTRVQQSAFTLAELIRGTSTRLKRSRAAGATPEEIMEMLKLCISRGSGSHLIQSAGREERTALPTVG